MKAPSVEDIANVIEDHMKGLVTIHAVGGPYESMLAEQYNKKLQKTAAAVRALFLGKEEPDVPS